MPANAATGMNTASSTSELATTALVISFIAAAAPANGSIRFSLTKRAMFSMTTIASSTTSPVASVSPNKVSVLIENPRTFINANVPISETGMVIAGMSVVRQLCKNKNTTAITSTIEIASVLSTSRIDSLTNGVASKPNLYVIPCGKCPCNRSIVELTSRATCSAFALGSVSTAMPIASAPLSRRSCA